MSLRMAILSFQRQEFKTRDFDLYVCYSKAIDIKHSVTLMMDIGTNQRERIVGRIFLKS